MEKRYINFDYRSFNTGRGVDKGSMFLPQGPNDGTRILNIEVPVSAIIGGKFKWPDTPTLDGKPIIGMEIYCNSGGAITAPTNFVPTPLAPSGASLITFTDLCNMYMQLNDLSQTAIIDQEPANVFNPSSNYGTLRSFDPVLLGVVITNCNFQFSPGYTPSGTKVVLVTVRYLPYKFDPSSNTWVKS